MRAERRKQWKIHWKKYKHLYKGKRMERRNKWRHKWGEKYIASLKMLPHVTKAFYLKSLRIHFNAFG
ncbi:hypothetical protein ACNR9V_12135 [Parageobacillus thermoglucosidasius]|jgi:hypothetical protein|uniref:Uncharacterized protein n=1 Tax=Geobacillus sp. (strain WCH70) TaxID=471223 RepID=C5DAB7_GEOSW|nr:hypothetical protein [Parageobacillus thermoglucosidasius]GCD83024.1 hypothetical protein PTHTG4_20870 [Parageobacillus thermoglucosidasius]